MKAFRIRETWFETTPWGVSMPKFTAGQVLAGDDADGQRQHALNNADEIDVPEDADKAAAVAQKAREAAEAKAVAAEQAAAAAADLASAEAPAATDDASAQAEATEQPSGARKRAKAAAGESSNA
jgi:hypothetical protein